MFSLLLKNTKHLKGEIFPVGEYGYRMNTFEKIYEVVKKIPKGKVATYGQIATLAGNRHLSQIVGFALHVNPDPEHIPCYRVVNRFGEVSKAFAFGGENKQISLLRADGIEVSDEGKVELNTYLWDGK